MSVSDAGAPVAPDKGIGVREVSKHPFQSGFCGGSMFGSIYVTFDEGSHRRCSGHSTASAKTPSMQCTCACHAGGEPWADREQTLHEIRNGLPVTRLGGKAAAPSKPKTSRRKQ